MGHIRLVADLPRTRAWLEVVGLLGYGADVAQIATATIAAAERGLRLAVGDKGVVEAVWLLTQLPQAAKEGAFGEALRARGIMVSDSPSLMEIVSAVTDCIDSRMPNCQGRTDFGEMAQMAAVESITETIGNSTQSLFGTMPEDVQRAFANLNGPAHFGDFSKQFFGRLVNKCLNYFLSRAISHHVGEGQRFRTLAHQTAFSKAMDVHCKETSVIVRQFSAEWFSKHKWETQNRITRQEAAAFASHAMTKLVKELKLREQAHA